MQPHAKTLAKQRGLLLGTTCLVVYLLVILPGKQLGVVDFSYGHWLVALLLTFAVQGSLWLLLRFDRGLLNRYDPRFLHLPVLAASLLFNIYLFLIPELRVSLLICWMIVLLFAAGGLGFRAVAVWSTFQLVGYTAVLYMVRARVPSLSLRSEAARLWVFACVCFGVAVMFERLHRRLTASADESQRVAARLRESEARLRQVIDLVPHFIFAKDRDGRFILANRASAEAYGTRSEDLLGKTDTDFAQSAEEVAKFRRDDLEVIDSGKAKTIEEETITDAQGNVRFIQTTKIPFTFANSELPSLLGVSIDITARKRAEEERRMLEAQVQHVQKLESLGVLAGGIAHDFNNILVALLGYADLALMELPPEARAHAYLQRIVGAAERAADLIRQLLAYSGKGQFVVEILRLSQIVDGVEDLLAVSISKKARLHWVAEEDPVYVEADPSQLHQVLLNLITNASDALAGQTGTISITTGTMEVDHTYLASALHADGFSPGRCAFVEVADDGCGMAPAVQARIFDPFFTTKMTGHGLGLAAVLGIVRGHRGAIRVDSEEGRGTRIRLLLPLAPSPTVADTVSPKEHAPAASLPRTTGVLVVDDDAAVRELVTEILLRQHCHVLLAEDGAVALECYRQNAARIHLVLLDLTMPVMDGAETLRALRAINAEVRVVLMSGFSANDAATELAAAGAADFLQKPFTPQSLVDALNRGLEA